ncbi:hypothetical protein [Sulfitobacter indolifex]|uniref:hypothetical protein n=1 Tax=Sulfitobacter indolifex TaxID=225422 RepID=UPI00103F6713|nr:hypothetical protein [Sulfitobacter indolifex]
MMALYFSYGAHAGSLLISKATIRLCVSVGLKFEARKTPKQGLLERSFLLSFIDNSASLICFDYKMTGTREAPEEELQTFRTANALRLQSTPSRQGDKPEYLENWQKNLSDH